MPCCLTKKRVNMQYHHSIKKILCLTIYVFFVSLVFLSRVVMRISWTKTQTLQNSNLWKSSTKIPFDLSIKHPNQMVKERNEAVAKLTHDMKETERLEAERKGLFAREAIQQKNFGLSFGLKNRSRFHFYSETCPGPGKSDCGRLTSATQCC